MIEVAYIISALALIVVNVRVARRSKALDVRLDQHWDNIEHHVKLLADERNEKLYVA